MTAFVPGEPDLEIEDPLTFFLIGTTAPALAPERPPWQRLYTLTARAPYLLPWRFETTSCEACDASASVGTQLSSPRWARAFKLCLSCGYTTVETTLHFPNAATVRLVGKRWAPADPAVRTLRETILGTYRWWVTLQEWRDGAGDGPAT